MTVLTCIWITHMGEVSIICVWQLRSRSSIHLGGGRKLGAPGFGRFEFWWITQKKITSLGPWFRFLGSLFFFFLLFFIFWAYWRPRLITRSKRGVLEFECEMPRHTSSISVATTHGWQQVAQCPTRLGLRGQCSSIIRHKHRSTHNQHSMMNSCQCGSLAYLAA